MKHHLLARRARKAFTLVELAVVIVILGVLAAFGVPRFLTSVERSKAQQAFAYLSAVQSAQERHKAQAGTYASEFGQLGIREAPPKCFAVGAIRPGSSGKLASSWVLTCTRTGPSAGYGAYTVTFTDQGFDAANSLVSNFPDINPMGP